MATKPVGTTHAKTRLRMDKAVRLEALGLADREIAEHIGISVGGLALMKARPDYKLLQRQHMTGVISEMDEAFAESLDFQREQLQRMVPPALNVLFQTLQNRLEPKLQLDAAKQILDRDGRLAQVSRVGNALPAQGGFAATSVDIEIADTIAKAVKEATLQALGASASSNTTAVVSDSNGLITEGSDKIQ